MFGWPTGWNFGQGYPMLVVSPARRSPFATAAMAKMLTPQSSVGLLVRDADSTVSCHGDI
jgi:hypothetical protein